MTRTTRKWNKEQRDKIDYIERCTAFAHFRTRDEGRSRQYVYRFNTPEECAAAVHAHNKERKAAWTAEQANKL